MFENLETTNLVKNPESVNSPDERRTSVNFKPSQWPGLNILGKCHLLQFWEISTFRSSDGVQVQSGLGAFFRCVT